MVNRGFLFTAEGLIGAIVIAMTGLYVYRTFLAVKPSRTELDELGYSILETLDQEGKLARCLIRGNYSGLEQEIQSMLGAGVESRLKLFQYQVITVNSTKRTNWPVEVSLNFPKQSNPNFIQVYDSEMNLVPSQLDWSWYRIPVKVKNEAKERVNWPLRIDLNFVGFDVNGDGSTEVPDNNSIRVFTELGEEIPSVLKNWKSEDTNSSSSYSGSIGLLLDLGRGETKNLFVYYSVGTMKEPKSYDLPEFNLLPEASKYFIRQHYIWEIKPYQGIANGSTHYTTSASDHPELWGPYTAIHLYREGDLIDYLVFTDAGSEGSNCNWTDSRAEMNLTEYPGGSEVVLSDDECPGRDEFDLAGDPTGSWGGDVDGGVLELPKNWTIVKIEPIKATDDDLRWYSNGTRINLTEMPIIVYGPPPTVTHGVVEKAPRADLTFLADLSSDTFYLKFSIGTSKTRWRIQAAETDLISSTNSIENSKLKLNWSEANGATITELYYKAYGDENLVGLADPGAFDLPMIQDRTFHPPRVLSPWFVAGNFSILYKGPLRIIAKSHSEQFRSSTGEEKNITRDIYYKFFPRKSFFEVYAKYKFLENVTAKWGDYYPTSQRTNSIYFDWVAYVGEDGRVIPLGRVTDTTTGNWIDEWETEFGLAQIVKDDYSEVRYGKNTVNYGQFKKYGVNHEFVRGTQESFRYWWYLHLGNYTDGNVSELANQLVEKPGVSLRYSVPDGTEITETVLPEARSVASVPYFFTNDTFVELNLILWYAL